MTTTTPRAGETASWLLFTLLETRNGRCQVREAREYLARCGYGRDAYYQACKILGVTRHKHGLFANWYIELRPELFARRAVLAQARRLALATDAWWSLSNAIFSPGTGLIAKHFPTKEQRQAFRQTTEYDQLYELVLQKMAEHRRDTGCPQGGREWP